jgi:geranylgeranyl pyrophosphate synthase
MSGAQPTVITDNLEGTGPLSDLIGSAVERRWPRQPGLLDTICRYALVPTGKMFRPMLLLESAVAVGGEAQWVLPAAVGAECGHVASLIHDDIIDEDDMRRGRPSVQCKYGVADAIVAGDALIFDMFAGLAECHGAGVPADRVTAALDAVARAGLDLCRGQSLEAEICRNLTFDTQQYITMARLKTASFFRGACESGAIMGGGCAEWIDALATYGDQLGIAFQIHDDLLTYTSDSATTGKPGTSDIHNGRLTLPVILAYEGASVVGRDMILHALRSPGDETRGLAILSELVTTTGALAAGAQIARNFAKTAREALTDLPMTASRDRLVHIADLVINRDH